METDAGWQGDGELLLDGKQGLRPLLALCWQSANTTHQHNGGDEASGTTVVTAAPTYHTASQSVDTHSHTHSETND